MSIFSWNLSNTWSYLWRYVTGCPKDDFLCRLTGGRMDLPVSLLQKAQTFASYTGIPPYISIPAATAVVAGCAYAAYQRYTNKETMDYIKSELKKRFGEPLYNVMIGPLVNAINDAIRDYEQELNKEKPLPADATTAQKEKRNKEARDKIYADMRANFDKIMQANRREIENLLKQRKKASTHRAKSNGTKTSTASDTTDIDLRNFFFRLFFIQPSVTKQLRAAIK